MDQLASDALFIRWGEFQAGAFGRFAIVVLAIITLIGWFAPMFVRHRGASKSGRTRTRGGSDELRRAGRT
jgi:hypothetical protein